MRQAESIRYRPRILDSPRKPVAGSHKPLEGAALLLRGKRLGDTGEVGERRGLRLSAPAGW